MNKQNVVCTYNGILASLKKDGSPVICYNTDRPESITLTDISQSPKDTDYVIPLIRCLEQSNSETECRLVVYRGWGRDEKGCCYFNCVTVLQDEKGSGDVSQHEHMVKVASFYVVFSTIKIIRKQNLALKTRTIGNHKLKQATLL